MKAYLALEDGTVIEGKGIGVPGIAGGELVFETGMSGYVESLTDPSYNGQILMFTYPLIGNYGVNSEDAESSGIKCKGLVVKELCSRPSHWKSERSLNEFLKDEGISGIQGVDTRWITKKVRHQGTMRAVLSVGREDAGEELVDRAKALPRITEIHDLVSNVSVSSPVSYLRGNPHRMVVMDCGIKNSILNNLLNNRYDVIMVPHDTPSEEILNLEPHGVLITNGPGDPAVLTSTIETVKALLDKVPLFGICLGHLVIARACGAETFKLKYGHRGLNQPVKDLANGKVYMTTQNHGFSVSEASLDGTSLYATQLNLNDSTVEGMGHEELPIRSVQYHPEAHPGPQDTTEKFFREMNLLIKGG